MIWEKVKQCARYTRYAFNGYGIISRYFLEATLNNSTEIKEIQKITAARLTYEPQIFNSILNIFKERLENKIEVYSVQKSLFFIDFVLKYGKQFVLDDIIQIQPMLEDVSISKIYKNSKNEKMALVESDNRSIAQTIILLINNYELYQDERKLTKEKRNDIKRMEIKLNISERLHKQQNIQNNMDEYELADIIDRKFESEITSITPQNKKMHPNLGVLNNNKYNLPIPQTPSPKIKRNVHIINQKLEFVKL